MKRTLALIQLHVEAGDKATNIANAFARIKEAASKADIIVLPEMWTTGYNLSRLSQQVTHEGDELLQRLEAFARERKKWIVTGSLPTKENEKVYNRTHCFGPDGVVAQYDKTHLFSLLSEPDNFAAGNQIVSAKLADIHCGLSICYDLRFPELYRKLALDGVTLVFVPAEWPTSRLVAWENLIQARAIENQMYICAVNAVGTFKNNIFAGRSALIDPMGENVVKGDQNEAVLYGEYDSDIVKKTRARMSVFADRRPEVYGGE
ncbi:MAG: carbon-nitrogen family hydrolase [Negativicoccus succinicivorans]|uniref:carbon-nitrogen family hydrolase n=1 Tax=Negativicoccus succinicivorans TaxID=620903 RepID=UPI0026F1B937|nr:carbon-nitrogen family hydrolase [Negativicoccus succinicivorans]MBS6028396.1 carbon-nitrogen family hydrolase [Negativicoccus succinicivorans]